MHIHGADLIPTPCTYSASLLCISYYYNEYEGYEVSPHYPILINLFFCFFKPCLLGPGFNVTAGAGWR